MAQAVARLIVSRTDAGALVRHDAKIPSSAVRKRSVPREPKLVVAQYARFIRNVLARIQREIAKEVVPALIAEQRINDEKKQDNRWDALPTRIAKAFGKLELRFAELIKDKDLTRVSRALGKRVAGLNKKQIFALLKKQLAITPKDLGLNELINQFVKVNTDLIKSLAGEQVNEIKALIEDPKNRGLRVEAISKKIQARFEVSKSKANLIARDQILKMNGKLTQVRQENAGVKQYVWTTVKDGDVRKRHAQLEGTVQSWSRPPIVSKDGRREHPGGDFQCRCIAFPIVPDFSP